MLWGKRREKKVLRVYRHLWRESKYRKGVRQHRLRREKKKVRAKPSENCVQTHVPHRPPPSIIQPAQRVDTAIGTLGLG